MSVTVPILPCEFVRKLQAEYPELSIELVVCERTVGHRISKSAIWPRCWPSARYELLLVNDSDIRVARDYLRHVVTPLADSSVGLVTCLYRGIATNTLGSRLEALGHQHRFYARCAEREIS